MFIKMYARLFISNKSLKFKLSFDETTFKINIYLFFLLYKHFVDFDTKYFDKTYCIYISAGK